MSEDGTPISPQSVNTVKMIAFSYFKIEIAPVFLFFFVLGMKLMFVDVLCPFFKGGAVRSKSNY